MISNFDGKFFDEALINTKYVLDDQKTQSSLTQKYMSNTDIDICNTVLYYDKPHVAVIDPENNTFFYLAKDKKIFISKCININTVEDYRLMYTYIYNILVELRNYNERIPDTLIIPYISNNLPNALVLENYKSNKIQFAYHFLYNVEHLNHINNGLKPSNLYLDKKSGLYEQTDNIFEFLYNINDIVNVASAKDYDKCLDVRNITKKYNDQFEDELKNSINLEIQRLNDTKNAIDIKLEEKNNFNINIFLNEIERIFTITDKYIIQKTNDSILVADKINNKQVIKAQVGQSDLSVVHDGNNNTWLALFNAMHKTKNFKCEFSFIGNNENRKKLAIEFLQAVGTQIDKNDGSLNDVIFDIDDVAKNIIYQILNDKAAMNNLNDKLLTYFGLNANYSDLKSKNTLIFQKTEVPKRSFKMS